MSDANIQRLVIALAGALLLAWMYVSGTRKRQQGERVPRREASSERVEPTLGDPGSVTSEDGMPSDWRAELDRIGGAMAQRQGLGSEPDLGSRAALRETLGAREESEFERVITLYVSARDAGTIGGPELVVAAEKAGLEFGARDIFHRLLDGNEAQGPVFSVANMLKPGSFDMSAINELHTPGVCFFMTLPGPVAALDGWDAMLAAAQRFAELLDAQVLDAQHNALGRQTIQHIRDELRAFDRKREKNTIKKPW
jgi:cell division protein ZipA